jgi:hypothetical protein
MERTSGLKHSTLNYSPSLCYTHFRDEKQAHSLSHLSQITMVGHGGKDLNLADCGASRLGVGCLSARALWRLYL